MKFSKIIVAVISICLVQISCDAPTQVYPDEAPTPIHATVPSLMLRGEEYSLSYVSDPDAVCHAGISFWDVDGQWVYEELAPVKADPMGVCEWVWEVPGNAKDGEAEFRGFAEGDTEIEYVFPTTFCVEKCP